MFSKNSGTPTIIYFNRVFKPSIFGVPLIFWKHPKIYNIIKSILVPSDFKNIYKVPSGLYILQTPPNHPSNSVHVIFIVWVQVSKPHIEKGGWRFLVCPRWTITVKNLLFFLIHIYNPVARCHFQSPLISVMANRVCATSTITDSLMV